MLTVLSVIEPQNFPYEAEACARAEAEQTHPTMDPIEDGQHDTVSGLSG